MMMYIDTVAKTEYTVLIDIWERAVRSSHFFLSENDIVEIKKQILEQYFDMLHLMCVRDNHQAILGFCGIAEDRLEMLFIDPNAQGMGIGSLLCKHVMNKHGISFVDVNEQNPKALSFYQKMGFHMIGRSECDPAGRPFPILHLSYKRVMI